MTSTFLHRSPSELQRSSARKAMVALGGQFLTAVIFSLKTFAAALLALFIAFWLGLDDPRWALLTVFVVAQPDSGLVLAKSFYRIIGTAAGVLITVALPPVGASARSAAAGAPTSGRPRRKRRMSARMSSAV